MPQPEKLEAAGQTVTIFHSRTHGHTAAFPTQHQTKPLHFFTLHPPRRAAHLVQLLVNSTVNPLVAAATAGIMPSSSRMGDKTMPAAMPSAPAAMPQPKQMAGYSVTLLLSHFKSPLSDLTPAAFLRSAACISSFPKERVRGTWAGC